MKLFVIFSLLVSFNLFAQYDQQNDDINYQNYYQVKCIKELENKYNLPEALVFDISACENVKALDQDIASFLILRSGYQFEWYNRQASNINEALVLLSTDHQSGDGSGPFSEVQIEQIVDFYTKPGYAAKDVEMIEFADSYYSGTGVTQFVVFYSVDKSEMILIEKFIYAE